MLLSEDIRSSLHQHRLGSSTDLVWVLHLKQVHGGQHRLRQCLPHGITARAGGQDQLAVVDVVEDTLVHRDENNARGDEGHRHQTADQSFA